LVENGQPREEARESAAVPEKRHRNKNKSKMESERSFARVNIH